MWAHGENAVKVHPDWKHRATLHGNLPIYFCLMEEAQEEEDKDHRKKEEEKSGQTNYYVHCRWNVSPFSGGGQNVFLPDFCVLQPTVIETGFHIFLWLNIAQLSASVVLMQEDGERADHQLDWLLHSPSPSFVGLLLSRSQCQPAQCHPVFNHGGLFAAKGKWINE